MAIRESVQVANEPNGSANGTHSHCEWPQWRDAEGEWFFAEAALREMDARLAAQAEKPADELLQTRELLRQLLDCAAAHLAQTA